MKFFPFFKKEKRSEVIRLKAALTELDRIAKMLVRRDLELSFSKEKLAEEKGKIDAVINSLADGLIMVGQDQKIVLINPEAKAILGAKEEDLLGKTLSELTGFPHIKKLHQALGGKVEWTGKQYELALKKPLKRFFQARTVPVVTQSQEAIGLMIVLHDITREKEIGRMKTEFVSIAAHQLRTPLSAIKWVLRMVLDGDVGKITKEQAALLERGYQNNERMIILINDLLNVARIEEGRFLYNSTLRSLEDLIRKVIDSLTGPAKEKKIKLIFIKPQKPLPQVKIDVEKIELVIQNLIDNAIRFNRPGGQVTISIKCDKINIEVMIKDTGIGIPYSQQGRIFDKFFRTDNAVKSETEGTGLGLFICKNIIEAHGGKIWFESDEDKGSTFWFNLPIKS
jgi:PAS domain S-box-containing protein